MKKALAGVAAAAVSALIAVAAAVGMVMMVVTIASKSARAHDHAAEPKPVTSAEMPLYVHDADGLSIKLMKATCSDTRTALIIAMSIPPEFQERFSRAIDSTWKLKGGGSKDFAGCWGEFKKDELGLKEDSFVLIFEDGESYAVPRKDFGKPKNAKDV